jgi:hypothetical protein
MDCPMQCTVLKRFESPGKRTFEKRRFQYADE